MDKHDLDEGDDRAPYETPEFSVVSLSMITLGGTGGTGDSGNALTEELRVGTQDGLDPVDEYDKDPLGDPWAERDR